MQISIAGGSCILGSSYATLHSDSLKKLPEIHELFTRIPARLGRFDDFTRLGFAAIGLALQDAGRPMESGDAGLIISTQFGVMQTDFKYYATTIEQNALLSSPNLFSYTLPVTVIGECASYFHLTGPTFCIGDDGRSGMKAVETSIVLLRGRRTKRMIAAWIECAIDFVDFQQKRVGAAAVVLESTQFAEKTTTEIVRGETIINIENVASLSDFFGSVP